MGNQQKVLNELSKLVNTSMGPAKGVASFKKLAADTKLSNEQLDEILQQLEKDGFIVEYPMNHHDEILFQLLKRYGDH